MQDIKQFLARLSHHPGVYQMLGEQGEILYVGKAKDLKKRISSYFNKTSKDSKTNILVKQIRNIDFTITHNENEAVLLECNLIKQHHPRYNVLLRDDKSYPYILITHQHPFPRIDIYRGARKRNALYFGPYPSAYAVRDAISLLQKIFRIRTCRDTYFAARKRPCLLYQIERCTAPCVNYISQDDYAHAVQLAILFLEGKSDVVVNTLQEKMEKASQALEYEAAKNYRDQINKLRQLQDKQYVSVAAGNVDVVGMARISGKICLQLLSIRHGQVQGSRSYFPDIPMHTDEDEILAAFLTQHYLGDESHIESIPSTIVLATKLLERDWIANVLSAQAKHKVEIICPARGEKKKWLAMATISAKQSLTAHLFAEAGMKERLQSLQQALNLPYLPKRMECFDISHSMGEATVASCVVFDAMGPVKSAWRRFNLTGITKGDDVAAMHQVLLRRFKRLQKENVTLPDLVFIDGGLTQLAAAQKVMASLNIEEVLLVAIAKGPERKPGLETLHRAGHPPQHLSSDSPALLLLQQIRDEAHRFAITGHRQRRDKARRQSRLELIPGIGQKRRRELLRYFGGIQGIAHASLDELVKVPGINRPLAERLFAALHDETV